MDNTSRKFPDFSIIIPCKNKREAMYSLKGVNKLEGDFEVIVVPDPSCPGLPAEKRNWAMARATGKYLAFIDSDAYPAENWLSESYSILKQGYAGVCGPGVLPKHSRFQDRVSDLVFRMLPYSYRVTPKKARIVKEFPTFNLIVRRDLAPKFKLYLTGEDSLFCREIEGDIYYSPDILVYHKRRKIFKPLWKQVGTYGYHRGILISLAFTAWVGTIFVYSINFIKGFIRRKP